MITGVTIGVDLRRIYFCAVREVGKQRVLVEFDEFLGVLKSVTSLGIVGSAEPILSFFRAFCILCLLDKSICGSKQRLEFAPK